MAPLAPQGFQRHDSMPVPAADSPADSCRRTPVPPLFHLPALWKSCVAAQYPGRFREWQVGRRESARSVGAGGFARGML